MVIVYHVFETLTLFLNAIVNELKSLVIEETIAKLRDDFKLKLTDSVADIRTLKDAHDWHNLVSTAVEDNVAWKSTRVQFDHKVHGLNLTRRM